MRANDARTLSPTLQQDLRKTVVKAVQGGLRKSHASREYGVSRTSIDTWLKKYEQSGEDGLGSRKRGPKGGIRLGAAQSSQTVRWIAKNCPDALGLPYPLWTREAVSRLIKDKFGMDLSIWTIGRYLSLWGLKPSKPLRRVFEQAPDAVRKWLDTDYPALHRQAKAEKAEVQWCDIMDADEADSAEPSTGSNGSHGSNDHSPRFFGNGNGTDNRMICSLTNRGALKFRVFPGPLNSEACLDFLDRLADGAKKKVFLIAERHPLLESAEIQKWRESNAEKIQLFFLPAGGGESGGEDVVLNRRMFDWIISNVQHF